VGAEVPSPIVNESARAADLSNEIGASGRTRLLKDVVGLWMLAESQRQWRRAGTELSYEELVRAAGERPTLQYVFDPDEPTLLLPGDIPARIADLCSAEGALDPATTTRAIVDSIALKVRLAIDQIELAADRQLARINLVGGGVRNHLLCQAIADACARPVIAGPREATALGNIIVQLMASGDISSLEEGRELLARTTERTTFEPSDQARWQEGYAEFRARFEDADRR
jgi:sugar (pentulose or hexulose) kinase